MLQVPLDLFEEAVMLVSASQGQGREPDLGESSTQLVRSTLGSSFGERRTGRLIPTFFPYSLPNTRMQKSKLRVEAHATAKRYIVTTRPAFYLFVPLCVVLPLSFPAIAITYFHYEQHRQ